MLPEQIDPNGLVNNGPIATVGNRTEVKTQSWAACYVNPVRGVAFFDDITIEADAITDPRWNSVRPVFQEEQILMCRQMDPLLKPGNLVLDVGTGNGIFAVYAAKRQCKVIAIDISGRALRRARRNAVRNGLHLAEEVSDYNDIADGQILFERVDFKSFVERESNSEKFNIVLLSPTYNPVCPLIFPNPCDEFGLDGQNQFRQQVVLAPTILKVGGYCIGNQMSGVNNGGRIDALDRIEDAFDERCSVRYAHALNDSPLKPTDEFLQAQYASYLMENQFPVSELGKVDEEEIKKRAVKKYIDEVSASFPNLAFIYYEVEKLASLSLQHLECYEIVARPDKQWQDRMWLHRCIVDHTSSTNSFPSPALFMQQDSTANLPIRVLSDEAIAEGENEEKWRKAWKNSALLPADDWVCRTGALQGSTPLFDMLFVDTAPWYQSIEGARKLSEECKVWLSEVLENKSPDKGALRLEVIRAWQLNTMRLQRTKMGPFLHPHFTGQNAQGEWRSVQVSELDGDKGIPVPLEEQHVFERMLAEIESQRDDDHKIIKGKDGYLEDFGYSRAEIGDLEVRVKGYQEVVSARVERLQSDKLLKHKYQDHEDATRRDLELCHLVKHVCLRQRMTAITGKSATWSILIGIPASVAFTQMGSGQVPRSYRGGIWLYASSSKCWEYDHERLTFDLVRLLWLLYNGRYNLDANRAETEVSRREQQSIFAHQAAGLVGAVMMNNEEKKEDYDPHLIHLKSLIDVWGNSNLEPDESIFQASDAPYYSSLKSASNQEFLDKLIDVALQHSRMRAMRRSDNDDEASQRLYRDARKSRHDPINSIRQKLGLTIEGEVPDWIQKKGFVLLFHHCFWQAGYHAWLASHDNQEAPFLWLEFDSYCLRICNRAEALDGSEERKSKDQEFLELVTKRLQITNQYNEPTQVFSIQGPSRQGNVWITTITYRGRTHA